MRLAELILDIDDLTLCGPVDRDAEICDLTHDYARVEPGFIYTCLPGEEYAEAHLRAGPHAHIGDALDRGAACVLLAEQATEAGLPGLVSARPKEHAAMLADRLHGQPLAGMTTVGVTGTNGKTSVTFMLASIFMACGRTPGVAGTLGFWAPDFRVSNSVYTTPLAADLYRNAAIMRTRGVEAFLIESTSHGLALAREREVQYNAAVFTNLSRDHLDFHGDMGSYVDAKLSLFRRLRGSGPNQPIAIINGDDPLAARVAAAASEARVLRCSLRAPAEYRGRVLDGDACRSRLEVTVDGGQTVELTVGVPGRYNVENALLAFASAHGLGLGLDGICAGLARPIPVPGRFEVVDLGQPFTVVVDYAHTPAALAEAIASARALSSGRVLTVFGAGGQRDRDKRPEMGLVAATGSDRVIVTSDNPRWEDPLEIIREIEAGVTPELRARVDVLADRGRAIARALDLAKPGDLVLICGKGHETEQLVRGRAIPFDDRAVARAHFARARADQRY